MRYQQFQPGAPLARFVRCIWTMSDDAAIPGSEIEHVVPDGCVEMIFHLGTPFMVEQASGGFRRSPGSLVAGQITRCLRMFPTGPYQMVGVRFQPWGASAFLDAPIHQFTNRIEPVDSVWSDGFATLRDRIASTRFENDRIQFVRQALIERLCGRSRHDALVEHCIERLIASEGRITIDELIGPHTVGARQLERRFRDVVGIPPKLLARIIRFRKVFEFTERSQSINWIDTALGCGYYDQAHLIRDFRELAGRTPTAFVAEESGIGKCLARAELLSKLSQNSA